MCSRSKHAEKLCWDVWADQIRGPREQQPEDSTEHVCTHECLDLVVLKLETVNDPRDAETTLLNYPLIAAIEHAKQGRHHSVHALEAIGRNVAARIRCRSDRLSLGA